MGIPARLRPRPSGPLARLAVAAPAASLLRAMPRLWQPTSPVGQALAWPIRLGLLLAASRVIQITGADRPAATGSPPQQSHNASARRSTNSPAAIAMGKTTKNRQADVPTAWRGAQANLNDVGPISGKARQRHRSKQNEATATAEAMATLVSTNRVNQLPGSISVILQQHRRPRYPHLTTRPSGCRLRGEKSFAN